MLMCAPSPSPVRIACSTQERLITGSMPGNAASTKLTCALGAAPKSVAAEENSFALEIAWAWTSSPMMISQLPVRPSIIMSRHHRRLRSERGRGLDHARGANQGLLVEGAANQL